MKCNGKTAPQHAIELALPKRLTDLQRQKLTQEILDILSGWWMYEAASRADDEARAARESLIEIASTAISALERARSQIEHQRGTVAEEDMPTERYVPASELDDAITTAVARLQEWMPLAKRHNRRTGPGRSPALSVDLVRRICEIATNGGLKPKQTKYLIKEIRRELDPTLPTAESVRKRLYRTGQRRRTK